MVSILAEELSLCVSLLVLAGLPIQPQVFSDLQGEGSQMIVIPRQMLLIVEYHVLCGGSWLNFPGDCRFAYRGWSTPEYSDGSWSFRVCKEKVTV